MTKILTAPERLMLEIMEIYNELNDDAVEIPDDPGEVSGVFYANKCDYLGDIIEETRSGEVETEIPKPYSRHYESKSVAKKCGDDWVGWTYWYGGGKHGEPESIPWIEEAYYLDVTEEEKLVTVRTFKKSAG